MGDEHRQMDKNTPDSLIHEQIREGEALFSEGKVEEAENHFRSLLDQYPEDPDILNNLGVISHFKKDIKKAIDYFTKALQIDPYSKDALINYSGLLKDLGVAKEIEPLIENAVKKFPKDQELCQILNQSRSAKQLRLKIGVFCLPGLQSFLGDIVAYLSTKYDVRTCYSNNEQEIESTAHWADIVWLEWANELAISMTNHPTLLEGKRVICRLHSYEAFAGYAQKIQWGNVHDLIFVADHIKQIVQNQVPSMGQRVERVHVIPNGVDLDRFPFKDRSKGRNLAYVGYVNYKKGPVLLLHAFRELVQFDKQYKLFIAGNFQDTRYELYFSQMIKEMRLEENIVLCGWVEKIESWLTDKNYIISTSVLEGHPVGLMEAMSLGLKPVIHNYVGARCSYPGKYLWNTIPEFVTRIREDEYNPLEYRQFIEENYPLQRQLARIETVLRQSEADISSRETAYPKKQDVDAQGQHSLNNSGLDVTAVIAVRNGEKTIRKALDSLLSQTAPLRKIIVVDDCSNDQTPHIVKDYQRNYGQIIELRQLNRNHWVFRARNTGFSLVDTKYFFFLDADDTVAPEYTKKLVYLLKGNPDCSFAFADMIYFDESSKQNVSLPDFDPGLLGNKNYIPYSAMMVAKDFKSIGGYNNYLSDSRNHLTEWDLWLRFVRSGKKGVRCREPLFFYYQSATQMSRNYERTRNDMVFQMAMSQKANATLDLQNKNKILFVCQGKDYLDQTKMSFEVYTWLKPLSEFAEVFTFFYDLESQHFGRQEMIDRLLFTVDKTKPDYIFHPAFKEHIPIETWKQISREVLTIAWFSDDNWRFDTYSSKYCRGFRYSVTTYPRMVDKYIDIGYKNIILSQWAANEYYFKDYKIPKKIDVSFCGQNYGDRQDLLKQLKVECYGRGWPNGMLDFPEMAKTLSKSKMSINFSRGADGTMQMKCRPFEVSACNTLLLCEYTDMLDQYYSVGKEVVSFRDEHELKKSIEYYLKNEDERLRIANAGFERTLSEHTWQHRFKGIFEEIKRRTGSSVIPTGDQIKEKQGPSNLYNDQFYGSHLKYKDIYYFIGDTIGSELKPFSAIDWGCGCGFLLEKLELSGVEKFQGIEGSEHARKYWVNSIKDHIVVGDLLKHEPGDKFELAVCMEVAEHIPEKHADKLVAKVAASSFRYIWWTAAVPGQLGDGHENCQPLSYWAEKFQGMGFDADWEMTYKIKLKMLSYPKMVLGYPWFRDNLLIFKKRTIGPESNQIVHKVQPVSLESSDLIQR